jgi:putative membrane protein
MSRSPGGVASGPDAVSAPEAGGGTSSEVDQEADTAPIPSTRASRTWTALLPALILLGALLLFVFQNLQSAKVSFVTLSGRLPLGLALLATTALGALLVLALGSVRIVQLRKLARRRTHHGHAVNRP